MRHDDPRLRELLGQVTALIREHGPRADQVREFIRANLDYPRFKGLAYTLVIVKEGLVAQEAERELLGKGPVCDRCQGDGAVGVLPCEECGGTGDGPAE